jgi:Coenzyme PQQ synthesis protein D (PqqD)
MSDFLETRYEKDPSIVFREIAGEAILVPIRQSIADLEKIYTLNGIGVFIWHLIDGQRSNNDIKSAVLNEYDVPPDDLLTDLSEFLQQLESIGAIAQV